MEKLFHNIMHQPISFPSTLSEQGRSLLESVCFGCRVVPVLKSTLKLLQRDPSQRLGCGKDDGEELIRHPFFQGIDFEKLKNKVYQPPFKPKVVRTWEIYFLFNFFFFFFFAFSRRAPLTRAISTRSLRACRPRSLPRTKQVRSRILKTFPIDAPIKPLRRPVPLLPSDDQLLLPLPPKKDFVFCSIFCFGKKKNQSCPLPDSCTSQAAGAGAVKTPQCLLRAGTTVCVCATYPCLHVVLAAGP